MLGDFCQSYPYVVDCTMVDRNRIMVLVEPEEYTEFEGSDISTQEQVILLQQSKKPVLSRGLSRRSRALMPLIWSIPYILRPAS